MQHTLHSMSMLFHLMMKRGATIRPVLKHGPRSSTGLRVVELLTINSFFLRRSESKIVPTLSFYYNKSAARADYGHAHDLVRML